MTGAGAGVPGAGVEGLGAGVTGAGVDVDGVDGGGAGLGSALSLHASVQVAPGPEVTHCGPGQLTLHQSAMPTSLAQAPPPWHSSSPPGVGVGVGVGVVVEGVVVERVVVVVEGAGAVEVEGAFVVVVAEGLSHVLSL